MSQQQAKQLVDDYYAGAVSLEDAAAQLASLIGDDNQVADDKLVALLDAIEPQTAWVCVTTVTVATSCSNWCR